MEILNFYFNEHFKKPDLWQKITSFVKSLHSLQWSKYHTNSKETFAFQINHWSKSSIFPPHWLFLLIGFEQFSSNKKLLLHTATNYSDIFSLNKNLWKIFYEVRRSFPDLTKGRSWIYGTNPTWNDPSFSLCNSCTLVDILGTCGAYIS